MKTFVNILVNPQPQQVAIDQDPDTNGANYVVLS